MIAALRTNLARALTIIVVLAIVAGGVWYFFVRGSGNKTVTADFPAAVGIYPGTPVKVRGVQVGDVTSVVPKAGYVEVKMEYSSTYKLPPKAKALEVANSLVSDRFVQLQVYPSKYVMKSGATIPSSRTSAPAELDDIYSALNKLSVALGPAGVNKGGQKNGALSALVNVSAANLKNNGAAIGNSITQLSAAAQTLSDNRGDLFATVRNLQKFTTTLKNSDSDVRAFNDQLAQAASDLASERGDLGAALHDLGLALNAVNGFVSKNASKFHHDFQGLTTITNILAKQKASLQETLAIAPVALANLVHTYFQDSKLGALSTRSNLASLSNVTPKQVLGVVCGTLITVTGKLGLGSLGGNVKTACNGVKAIPPSDPTPIGGLLGGGGIPIVIPGAGSASTPSTGSASSGSASSGSGSSVPGVSGLANLPTVPGGGS